jgi:hypothetical protein
MKGLELLAALTSALFIALAAAGCVALLQAHGSPCGWPDEVRIPITADAMVLCFERDATPGEKVTRYHCVTAAEVRRAFIRLNAE